MNHVTRSERSAIRVLHIQKVKGLGGSERHLLDLLPALAERGHDVRMLALTEGDWRRFAEPLTERGIAVGTAPAGADLDPRTAWAIRAAIRRFEPDLVHTHLIHAAVLGQSVARLAGVPAVATAHNVDPRLRRPPALQAARFAGGRAARTIAISDHVRAFLEELRIPAPGTIRVVPYGIDLRGRRLVPEARVRARAALDLGDDDIAVTVAARLIPGKGQDLLLDALVPALRGTPNLKLLIAGDGPARAALEAQARTLPRGTVRFLGFLDTTRELIGASDIVAFPTLPTLGEGFGLTALEAMAASVPVVSSDTGALPEVVADGETGLVVPGGSVVDLGDALARLAGDPAERRRMGDAGLRRARERFSLDVMVEGTVAVYREALGSDPASS